MPKGNCAHIGTWQTVSDPDMLLQLCYGRNFVQEKTKHIMFLQFRGWQQIIQYITHELGNNNTHPLQQLTRHSVIDEEISLWEALM